LPFTRSNKEGEQLYKNEIFSREHYEVKFQLSAKQQLFKINNFGLYIAYSQKSFWQAYYLEDSRPFRESNYNPELFLKYFFRKNLAIDFRGEHESNGGREPLSRSWNRIYIWPHFHSKNISINYKLWYRIPEKERKSPDDPEGDENPDIHKYLGYSKLGINFDFHNCQIAKTSHCNFKHKKVGFQLDLSIPTFLTSACLQFQYWGGYGESLIDYNVFQHKIGLDLILSR
jgi:phospholipase A1/A2